MYKLYVRILNQSLQLKEPRGNVKKLSNGNYVYVLVEFYGYQCRSLNLCGKNALERLSQI